MQAKNKDKETTTIKVYKKGLSKVRRHVEKTGQSIVAFYSIAAEKELKATTTTQN